MPRSGALYDALAAGRIDEEKFGTLPAAVPHLFNGPEVAASPAPALSRLDSRAALGSLAFNCGAAAVERARPGRRHRFLLAQFGLNLYADGKGKCQLAMPIELTMDVRRR